MCTRLALIVEGDPAIARLVGFTLALADIRCLYVEGREAVAQAAAHTPDLVLLDAGLSDIDIFALCRGLTDDC